ncbi:DEAD box helicase Mph1, putative [Talaromyces stipitatus ATCC 10500]|uniref:ATP-dependent DNA helicase n=1 Tax=Talaromyces stipitatus (strain ATCC 10500 / CBS 375.48 / QM 6759 / NRRL 1006) TaxID=441959 RepID=B8MHB5_TALSN|nr:DEAD box helicase Mph1, putative [Talaromyces stipitatus ATCC 10500]EED17094.1 DEAD box helicase Mph1, putative [Talaromyces stipitatus ATCC 10500]
MPSEFGDSDLDDFIVTSQDSVFDPPDKDADSARSPKRRRLNNGATARKSTEAGNKIQSSEYGSDDWDDDLPTPCRSRGDSGFEESEEQRSKYKIYVPKKTISIQENTFVSQTQPHSSPSHIRGPRWRKPEIPVYAGQQAITPQTSVNNTTGEEDDDLRAAIEASMHSFEEERGSRPELDDDVADVCAQTGSSSKQAATSLQQDGGFDLDDIPEDAFDSSPCLSPPGELTTSTSTRPIQSQRTNLRQTTLFPLATRDSTQGIRNVSPPPRDEPPTHHKLDQHELNTWGLFHNLLVALPTGLGKTFIAATVMLNWFRWTKDAQIVFTAPTKPLVSQQVTACLGIAGIPRSHTTLLTGNIPPGTRAEEWQTKRVFFMTPQTLINDLKTGIADPKRIVLLVVDEAHRATGGYAYVEVVKFLRRFNQSFRVLALTATPGSTVEAVQAVIDGLDISRVEIRTEQSLDIREYVHARNVDVQTFTNSEEMTLCMDLMTEALQPCVDQLRNMNAYWGRDPMMLTAYGLTKARQQWMASDAGRNANFGVKGKVNALFTVLASLAHSIDLLKYHGIVPFYNHLVSFKSNTDGQKGGKHQRAIVQDDNFKKLMDRLQPWCRDPEFIGHPKLGYLREIVLNHFMDAGEGTNGTSNTRLMIFAHFRDSAEEITRVLRRHEPIIRPHVFVGQASAKGSEGMDQKTQLSVIEKFKNGTYNTIVATSIGEEGLDIGEVDLIVCYDSSASPIRMLQRMGRTGRKRAGNIILLLMQGKEEESYIRAKDNYEKMQELIASGSRFEFHDDKSARILPKDLKPTVDKRVVEIPPENSQEDLPEPKKKGRAPKRPPKRFHMPDGVETGFTKASRISEGVDIRSMLQGEKGNKSKPKKQRTPCPVEVVKVPSSGEVTLTPDEEHELELRYRNVGGTTPQFICRPRNDAFPRLQRISRPTKLVQHGSFTRRMVGVLQKMNATSLDCDEKYESIIEDIRHKASTMPRRDTTTATKRSGKSTTSSTLPMNSKRKNSNTVRRAKSPSPARQTNTISPDSPLMCSQYDATEDENNYKPFFVSQISGMDDSGSDLPDIETLVRGVDSRKSKSRPTVIDSDDDDDDDFDFFN